MARVGYVEARLTDGGQPLKRLAVQLRQLAFSRYKAGSTPKPAG